METPDYTRTLLNISAKKLNELPDDLHLYTHLEKLLCLKNNLTHCNNLPPSLKVLSCYGNPFEYDFEPTLEHIREYNLQKQNKKNKLINKRK